MNSINSLLKRLRANAHQDPMRDWLILITLSFIALVSIVMWNVSAFGTLTNATVTTTTIGTPSIFSSTSLETIHTIFTNRTIEQEKYVTGVYHYSDPSL